MLRMQRRATRPVVPAAAFPPLSRGGRRWPAVSRSWALGVSPSRVAWARIVRDARRCCSRPASGQDGASRGGIRSRGERRGARPDSCRPRPAKDSQGIGRQGFVGLGGLRLAFGAANRSRRRPARGTGRRTHYAAQMSAAGTRTGPIIVNVSRLRLWVKRDKNGCGLGFIFRTENRAARVQPPRSATRSDSNRR